MEEEKSPLGVMFREKSTKDQSGSNQPAFQQTKQLTPTPVQSQFGIYPRANPILRPPRTSVSP